MAASARSNEWVDFFALVNGAALSRYPGLLKTWFPAGQLSGREFETGNLNGSPGKSLKVNTHTGVWKDFASDDGGSDPVSLYAAVNHIGQGEAGMRLGRELGIEPPKPKRAADNAWRPLTPLPNADLPSRLPAGRPAGDAGDAWLYMDAEGRPLMWRVRFDMPAGGKEVLPLTWCENRESGAREWRWKDLAAPRPLYNVEKLRVEPEAAVLVVEGEKCVDAAEALLGAGWTVVTWAGGAKRAGKKDTDWTPLRGRKVWIWPDNDDPGKAAALTIAEILSTSGPKPLIIRPSSDWPAGFDIADFPKTTNRSQILEIIDRQSILDVELRKEVVAQRGSVSQGDLFVADRFLSKHDKDVRYCPTRGWLIWDGKRWAWDEREEVTRLCEGVVRDLYREAADVENEDERAALVRFAIASSKIDRLRGSLADARTHVAVLQDELDRGEYFLNCANGTVDLRDGSLAPADREALITKLIDIDYGENARAERFERFLQEVFEGKAELIDYLQRAIGYSFTADLSEQCLHLLHGAGANGKSTLIDVLLKVSGDYGQTAGAQIVLTKFGTAIPTDIAALCGSRFISINETGESRAMDEAVVKTLTSVEPISARFLHRNFFNFVPTHHLWLSSNHKPRISGTDHGIWRRIRLIPFTQVFPLNLTLHEELESELPGILAWVVAGASKWYREGLEIPLEISRATKAYRSEQDVLDDFLKECCDEGPDCEILSKDLYELYKNWAKESGEDVWSKKLLGRRLADRGFVSGRTSTTNMAKWGGLSQKYYAKD